MQTLSKYDVVGSVIVGFLLATTSVAAAQPAQMSMFSLFAHAALGEDGVPEVKVNVSVPYTSLIFEKKGGQFESVIDVRLKVLDNKGKLVESIVLRDRVVAKSYRDTREGKPASKLSHVFNLGVGDYTIECVILVKGTHRSYAKAAEVNVPKFIKAGVGVGTPRFYAAAVDTLVGAEFWRVTHERGLVRREGTMFAEFDKQPAVRFQIYAERIERDSVPCEVVYEVVDKNKNQFLYGRQFLKLGRTTEDFAVSFNVDTWEPGSYTFNVKARLLKPPREAASALPFTVQFNRMMLETRFDETLAVLRLIADDKELEPLEKAPPGARAKAWDAFWKRRDPTPASEANEALEEHLRRLRYVMANFSSAEPGWRTDRGRVYIQHGEPDETEERLDSNAQGQYLIWTYYEKNLTFIFYDRYGLGDYRLMSTRAF